MDTSSIYSFVQVCLLAGPFLLLLGGFGVWLAWRRRRTALAWAAISVPVIFFVGVAATTYAQHLARTNFLSGMIVIPERLVPGKILAVTLSGEGSVAAYHLKRTGAATEVIAALENGAFWRYDGESPTIDFLGTDLFLAKGYGEVDVPFAGKLEDIDYVYVSGGIANFMKADPDRWTALETLGYNSGQVSVLYDASEGLPINLATSEPIFRFAQTKSVYFRLPNWSTDWSLEDLLDWEDFTPASVAGDTRFDILAERLAPNE